MLDAKNRFHAHPGRLTAESVSHGRIHRIPTVPSHLYYTGYSLNNQQQSCNDTYNTILYNVCVIIVQYLCHAINPLISGEVRNGG